MTSHNAPIDTAIYNDIAEYMRNHHQFNSEEISRDTRLEEMRLESLDLLGIAQIMQRKYSLSLNDDRISQIRTVGEFVDLVKLRNAEVADAADTSTSTE
ncbi:acyl carrier protein [Mycobacterium sp. 852002-40037_SCH5390672]|uniref:acyl carrier protein n=1 Tax=Mycobacterium sp. 852002-40037_SCH5390672 TaxID=1834089 RepID=UPI0012E8CBEF|nr:acyl carrier protein [Mycobacterium sp. 852002-40037_SCH5390672]